MGSILDLATYLSYRFGHEIISMSILSLLLIQKEQLSVTGERFGHLVVVNCLGSMPRDSVGRLNDQFDMIFTVLTRL